MEPIKVTLAKDTTQTMISNIFIDTYMPRANGEFVKIYLYYLRCLNAPGKSTSLVSVADIFSMTESDVLRALKYWEKEGILKLKTSAHKLTELILLPLNNETLSGTSVISAGDTLAANDLAQPLDASFTSTRQTYNGIPAYTMEEMEHFRQTNNGDELFFIIEQYLGKPLGPTDINRVVFFSEQLGFSSELIAYLFEYCVSNNHYSIHYIEKTALAWAREGIDTVAKAKNQTSYYNKTCFDILKAFGITNRNPAKSEMEHIKRWTREYGFSMALILEACRRTIEATHTPSFSYAESILKRWYEGNVGSMDDVKKLDEEHERRRQEKSTQKTDTTATRTPNKFHNFEQRDYDYNQLEQFFINKNKKAAQNQGGTESWH